MAGIAAVASIFAALVAAPLVLATYVVLQGTGRRVSLLWLAFLTLVLLGGFGAGALALVLLFLKP